LKGNKIFDALFLIGTLLSLQFTTQIVACIRSIKLSAKLHHFETLLFMTHSFEQEAE